METKHQYEKDQLKKQLEEDTKRRVSELQASLHSHYASAQQQANQTVE